MSLRSRFSDFITSGAYVRRREGKELGFHLHNLKDKVGDTPSASWTPADKENKINGRREKQKKLDDKIPDVD